MLLLLDFLLVFIRSIASRIYWFFWLLGLCTQVWCKDLEAQGDQSWLGAIRDFIKLKKCKGRGLVNYKDLELSHILIKYQD